MVVDEDHYIDHVFDSPGEHRLEASMFPTSHVALAVRTLVDPPAGNAPQRRSPGGWRTSLPAQRSSVIAIA